MRFSNQERCGYFVLEADAGSRQERLSGRAGPHPRLPPPFVRPGPASRVDPALKSLAAQLVRVTGSDPYLPADLDASVLFGEVLGEVADRLRPGQQLVLVVDGLDEAETPPGRNPLGLPSVLPPGVYCVVSHRPGVQWADSAPRCLLELRADDHPQHSRHVRVPAAGGRLARGGGSAGAGKMSGGPVRGDPGPQMPRRMDLPALRGR